MHQRGFEVILELAQRERLETQARLDLYSTRSHYRKAKAGKVINTNKKISNLQERLYHATELLQSRATTIRSLRAKLKKAHTPASTPVQPEDRIIDTLEPILNQHRLIVDKSVIDWDYKSNKDDAPEKRLMYMLFYQMSRMCREKGAVKHDDRLDALAQGVKYFTDAFGISAQEEINSRKRDEWNQMLAEFLDDPQASADHLVLGMNLEQRQAANGNPQTTVPTWV